MFAGGAAGRQEPKQCLAGPTEKSRFVPRISESCGGFQAGSDAARLVRKIVLGSIVEDGRRGRSGDWGPVRGPLQQGMRRALPMGVVVRAKGGRWMQSHLSCNTNWVRDK